MMDRDVLIDIVKGAITEELSGNRIVDRDRLTDRYPELLEKRAVFVTINSRGALRGCIGSIVAHRPLIDDLVSNAKAAAFSDPRFPPLRADELDQLSLEISLLSTPEELEYIDIDDLRSRIRPGVDGVILIDDTHQATYLPSVWEQLRDFDAFFGSLCIKAGSSSNCLDHHPTILTYQTEHIQELR